MTKRRSNLKRLAIFGGSFDPPHLGHASLIEQVLKTGLVSEVWLMPNFRHPWRASAASAKDRLRMCRLLENEKIKVSDLEIKRNGKSYTIETVKELKKKFKTGDFYWLIGEDLVKGLPRWKRANELLSQIKFLVFPRSEVSSSQIRGRVKKGLSIRGMVPKKVEEYIRSHKLYV